MVTVELEEIAPRRDYRLQAVIGCYLCFNENKKDWKNVNIFVHEGINQKCYYGHITKIHRQCTRCKTNYPIGADICPPCEERIEEIILREKILEDYDEAIDEIRRQMRKNKINLVYAEKEIKEIIYKKIIIANELESLLGKANVVRVAGELTRN